MCCSEQRDPSENFDYSVTYYYYINKKIRLNCITTTLYLPNLKASCLSGFKLASTVDGHPLNISPIDII